MKNLRGVAMIGLFGALAVTGWGQAMGRERCDRAPYGQTQYQNQYRRPSSYYDGADRYDSRARYGGRYDNGYYNNSPYNGAYDNRAYRNGAYGNGAYSNGQYVDPYNGDGYYYERPGSHSAAIIGGGAAAGAAIGGMAAGKKGAIIGAAAGGAAGLIYDRKTRYDTRW